MCKKIILLTILISGLLFVANTQGAYPVAIDFGTGSIPTDYGYTANGGASCDSSGVWDVNVGAGAGPMWRILDAPDYGETVIHGYADIDVSTMSTNQGDHAVVCIKDDTLDINFYFRFKEDEILIYRGGTVVYNPTIENSTGKHTYGWELNTSTAYVKIFYDGVQIGTGGGYDVGESPGESEHYFGDETGGAAHAEQWDNWVMDDGAYPIETVYLHEIDFGSGSLPTDEGFTANGGATADGSGVWDVDATSGQSPFWRILAAPSWTGPTVFGYAEITHETFTTSFVNHLVIRLKDDTADIQFNLNFKEDEIQLKRSATNLYNPTIENSSGKHVYGWELNTSTKLLKVYYDNVQIGDTNGYDVNSNPGEDEYYFGDEGASGAHAEEWDSWVIGEGSYVGPSLFVRPTTRAVTASSATSSSNKTSQEAAGAIDGSGLTGLLHDTTDNDMWRSLDSLTDTNGYSNPHGGTTSGPAWFKVTLDAVYNLSEMWVWNYNVGNLERSQGMKNVTIQYSTTGGTASSEWTSLGDYKFAVGTRTANYAHNTVADLGDVAAKYIMITAKTDGGTWDTNHPATPFRDYALSELMFFAECDYALDPSPADAATGVSAVDATLSWTPGDKAADTNGHDVYLGTSSSAVTSATTASSEYMGRQTAAAYETDLLYSTTYYWRIDEVNSTDIWDSAIYSFTTAAATGGSYSSGFSPADDSNYLDPGLVTELSWLPGATAASHDVYFGTNSTSVTNATTASSEYKGRQTDNTYTGGLGTLAYDTSYYWRIDEVNSAGTVEWTGSIVTCNIVKKSLDYDAITSTASTNSSTERNAPLTTDGSGMDITATGLFHDNYPYSMWMSGEWADGNGYDFPNPGTIAGPAWIRFDFDQIYELGKLWVWNYNQTDNVTLRGTRKVTIEYSTTGGTDSSEWTELGDYEFTKAPTPVSSSYAGAEGADFSGAEAKYVVVTANDVNGNWGWGLPGHSDEGRIFYGLSEVLFYGITDKARVPSPADSVIDVVPDASLSWTAGDDAASTNGHDVYLGTNLSNVTSATTASSEYMGRQTPTSYTPSSDLTTGITYYWRIDEVGGSVTAGDVWSFETLQATAKYPKPANSSTGWGKWITWTAGGVAAATNGHDIYIGTSFSDVNTATTASAQYIVRQTNPYYCSGFVNDGNGLASGDTIYWRIDSVDGGGSVTKGTVWNFVNSRRIIHNVDGDTILEAIDDKETEGLTYEETVQRWLDYTLTGCIDTHVDTLHWGDSGDSSVAEYNSVVLDRIGFLLENETQFVTQMIANGDDQPIALLNAAHEAGLEVFFGVRVNDIHDDDDIRYFSSFKNDNPSTMFGEKTPDWEYGRRVSLKFDTNNVRDLKYDVIEELAENYDFDGIMLDFMRHVPYTLPGNEPNVAPLMTSWLTSVRSRLDVLGTARGRRFEIAVRVNDTNEGCTLDGFEVTKWVDNGLIDQILPGNATIDVNVGDFTAMTSGTNVEVFPNIYLYPAGYDPSAEITSGNATNYWYLGADGMSNFNWFPDQYPTSLTLLSLVGDESLLVGEDKLYAVECFVPGSYYPHIGLDAELPKTLGSSPVAFDFQMLVGEDIDGTYTPTSVTIVLDFDSADFDGSDTMNIVLNNQSTGSQTRVGDTITVSPTVSDVLTGWNEVKVESTNGVFTVDKISMYVTY